MKKSFASLPSPVLACVVREERERDVYAAFRNGEVHGAAAFDLHLSTLPDELCTEEALSRMINATKLPVMALHYASRADGSFYSVSDEERMEKLRIAAKAGAACVDVQGYTFDPEAREGYRGDPSFYFAAANPYEVSTDRKAIERQMALFDEFHAMGTEVLLSTHTMVPMKCAQVVELAKYLEQRRPDIIKIIGGCENEEQMAEALYTMTVLKKEIRHAKIHYHCAGAAGRLTRVLCPVLGAHLTFCQDGYSFSSNFEQMDLTLAGRIISDLKKLL